MSERSLYKIEIAPRLKGWAVTVTCLLSKPEPVTQGRLTYKHHLLPTAAGLLGFLEKAIRPEGGGA